MTSKKSDPKQVYEDLKEQISKLNKTLKGLETRAAKPNFCTVEPSSTSHKTASLKAHKIGERDASNEADEENIQDAQAKLERDLETLKEIRTQKSGWESKIQGGAVGRRRKSKRCIQLEKLEKDVTNYKSLIGDILAEVEPVNQAKRFGAEALKEGKIPRNKEEKVRQDLAAIKSRWNALSEEVVNTTYSIDAFLAEVQRQYSKLKLWLNNAEVADSLLMEYDSYADKPEQLGATIRMVRLQLHENQNVLENFRKAKPRLHNMRDTAVALMKSGKLDETDGDELERVINILVAKYESIDNRLNASRDRIYAEINRLRERMVKQKTSILRRFSSKRNSSFRRKRSLRKKREIQQSKEMASRNLQAKKDSESASSSTSLDVNAPTESVRIVMIPADKEYEREKSRLDNQNGAYQIVDLALKACEKTIYDLDSESGWRSSAPASASELEKGLYQVTDFEAVLKKSRAEFQSQKETFVKAKEENQLDETDKRILERRVNNLQSKWEKLWADFIKKNRLQKQTDAFESLDASLDALKNTVHDLYSESLQTFSAVASNGEEVKKQLNDIMRFESDMKTTRSEFQSEVKRLQKVKQEGLLSDAEKEALEKKLNNLQSSWDELWKEIVQATLEQNHKSIQSITNDFDQIEKQMNDTTEIYDDQRLYLEENIIKQKRIMDDLHTYDRPINLIRDKTNILLEKPLMESQTFAIQTIQRKTEALSKRQQQLKTSCQENEDRLAKKLLLLDQRRNDSSTVVEEETVRINDDYSMLSQSLDDFLADEGFAELDSLKSSSEMKMSDFDMKVQSVNQWMTDTQNLVNSLHVRMDPGEVSTRVQKIKKRCEVINKKEAMVKDINRLGQEITKEPMSLETKEEIENKLKALNTRWQETKDMLNEYVDKRDEEAAYRSCCCFQIVTRAFHACFYS